MRGEDTYDNCMKHWVQRKHYSFAENWANVNGDLITNFSEVLALAPYILRAIRIQKMFKAREMYDKDGRIPRKLIKKWNEILIIKIFIGIMLVYIVCLELISRYFGVHLASYNLVEMPMSKDGLFIKEDMKRAFD